MNPKTLINEIVEDIKNLPSKDLLTIAEFIDFIKEKELEEEILTSKKLIKAIKASKKAWKEKKLAEFISWEDLKKKYHL